MTQEQILMRTGAQRSPEGQYSPPGLDPLGGQLVSGLLPPFAKLVHMGMVYGIDMSAGTPVIPVVAMPVASPQWGLYNASASLTMIVLRASASLASGTAGLGLALVGGAAIGVQTAVVADYAGTVKSNLAGITGGPEVFLDSNPTLIGGTPAWFAYEGTKVNTVGTDSVGDALVAPVDGMLIAKPGGHMVAFEVVGETGTSAAFDFQAIIAMVNMD